MIEEGQPFPPFSLSDQDGNVVTLDDLKGQKAVPIGRFLPGPG